MRARLLAIAVALAVGCMLATQGSAQDITARDREAVAARMAVLDQSMATSDFAGALDVLPPRLLRAMAHGFGLSEAEVRQAVRDAAAGILRDVTFVSYTMDLDAAEVHRTPTGARAYLLIPTVTVMDVTDAGRLAIRSHTLAMADEGEWYLIRVSEAAQADLLRRVYSDFQGVEFPPSTTEAGN